jgi:hypothetical protein
LVQATKKVAIRYTACVAENTCAIASTADERAEADPVKIAEHVRAKLNLAIQLACEAEHERRSCHWQSAEVYQRQWEEAITEVKRLLPLVRKSGLSLFTAAKWSAFR